MAKSSSQIPQQQEQIKQQDQPERPVSPIPFAPAKQVGFNLKDIIFNPNNEETFTRSPNQYKEYLSEFWYSAKALKNSKVFFSTPTAGIFGEWFPTIGYGEAVSAKGTLKKSLLPLRWGLLMAQIIQCLRSKTRGFDQITNKDAIMLYSLANGINIDYASLFGEDIIIKLNKKHRERVIPYSRFLSLLMMHKMKGYGDGDVTLNPTQVFSVNNWALKPNQPEGPSLTDHTLAIYATDVLVVFKAPKTSSKAEKKDSKGKKPGAKTGSSKIQTGSKSKATKDGQPPASTHVDVGMHKEDKQAAGGPTTLGVTSEEGAYPQLSSGMLASNLNKTIFLASFIIHSEFASGHDALVDSTTEADP
ncbi:hypothetical protein Tco_0946151 [Tanacetum coccineum]